MWIGVRYWQVHWQNWNVWYYCTGAWKFTSQWNDFVPPIPLSVILPKVCHLLTKYFHFSRKGSGTGACTNRIAMYDFDISKSTFVQVDEMILFLISSTSHFSWNTSLADNTPAYCQKIFRNWHFYWGIQVKEMILSHTSHSFWSPSLPDNTPRSLQELFRCWYFY